MRRTVESVTSLKAELFFGDRGVGALPVDGDLTLTVDGDAPWRGKLSSNALEAAGCVRADRGPAGRPTRDEVRACVQAAIDVDAEFLGLAVDWRSARFAVVSQGHVFQVEAAVSREPRGTSRAVGRATVHAELTDGRPDRFEFVLSDAAGIERDRKVVDVDVPWGPGVDRLAAAGLKVLDDELAVRGLPARTFWSLSFSEGPAWEGGLAHSGEVSVWTTVPQWGGASGV